MKINKRKIITLILIILWMCLVFYFSSQVSIDSSKLSGNITKAILNILNMLKDKPIEKQQKIIEITQVIIRKLAHYSVYTLGGILIYIHIKQYELTNIKKVFLSFIFGTAYAILDEIHQLFVPGRSGELRDVCIDSLGIITGILIITLLDYIIKRERRNKNATI